jgi:hypothetical protein
MNARVFFLTACICQAAWLPLGAQEDPIVTTEDPAAALPPVIPAAAPSDLPQLSAAPPVPVKPPASRILDPADTLTPDAKATLTRTLNAASAEGLSLYAVFLKTTVGLAEHDAATNLALLWQDAPLTAVFLHVPGQSLSLGYSATQMPSVQQDEIRPLMHGALQAGLTQTEVPDQVQSAAQHLTGNFLRYRSGQKEEITLNPLKMRNPLHRWIFWGGSATILFLLGLLLLVRHRRARRPRLFPLTAPRSRFSAPHSGGNNAMIRFDQGKN